MAEQKRTKIVVIGGGTGTSTVVSGLKDLNVDITAVVSMADSGGSTGRLRDEFGFQPVGDLRQSLAALSSKGSQNWIRKLLLYRFTKGEGLKGHNLGNLILTALQDMAGSTSSALEIAEQVFRLNGKVYPVTTEQVDLRIVYKNGEVVVGEDTLNTSAIGGENIATVSLDPPARMYDKAAEAIEHADIIVIGPGDFYASIVAALCVTDVKEVFAKTHAKIVYIVNLMTRYNQTHGMDAHDHVVGIEQAIGRKVDAVIMNTGKISQHVIDAYALEKEYPVEQSKPDARFISTDLIRTEVEKQAAGDELHRSLLRHDPKKLAHAIMEVL